jgi:crotonobetainyl-CoA:carnitine CoA-transferase CaiB-like acyl-CoA transferase
MNLGQYLTQYSPLPSGTVAQHLAAIAGRIGTGSGQTVFCSQFNVQVEQQELVVTRKAKRSAQAAPPVARAPIADKQQKNIAVLYRVPTMTVFDSRPEQLVVTRKRRQLGVS